MEKIYPISLIENILDKNTGENLYTILGKFNHINIGYVGSRVEARNLVPAVLRKRGLYITYYLNDSAVTEYFDGNKAIINENNNWVNDMYWKQVNTIVAHGTVEYRPTDVPIGFSYFDTTYNKTFWWNGEDWQTYPEDVKLIKKIKRTDIINTHRRCIECDVLENIPNYVGNVYIDFKNVTKVALLGKTIYLMDAENNYYEDCHSLQFANIFLHVGDTFYYLEDTLELTEVTEDNIDNYILPVMGTKCPDHGSVNPYENGVVYTVDKDYEVVMLIAFPDRFYGKVVEPYLNADDYN